MAIRWTFWGLARIAGRRWAALPGESGMDYFSVGDSEAMSLPGDRLAVQPQTHNRRRPRPRRSGGSGHMYVMAVTQNTSTTPAILD